MNNGMIAQFVNHYTYDVPNIFVHWMRILVQIIFKRTEIVSYEISESMQYEPDFKLVTNTIARFMRNGPGVHLYGILMVIAYTTNLNTTWWDSKLDFPGIRKKL